MKSTVNLYVNAVFPDGQIVQVGRILSRHLDSYGQYEGFFSALLLKSCHKKQGNEKFF